jgi:hypothetical protein
MDSRITAAARALAAGDPLGALKRVALRDGGHRLVNDGLGEDGRDRQGRLVTFPAMGMGVGSREFGGARSRSTGMRKLKYRQRKASKA